MRLSKSTWGELHRSQLLLSHFESFETEHIQVDLPYTAHHWANIEWVKVIAHVTQSTRLNSPHNLALLKVFLRAFKCLAGIIIDSRPKPSKVIKIFLYPWRHRYLKSALHTLGTLCSSAARFTPEISLQHDAQTNRSASANNCELSWFIFVGSYP